MLDEQLAFLRTAAAIGGWGAAARNRRHQVAVKVDTEDYQPVTLMATDQKRLVQCGVAECAEIS